jgi:IS1 family transposase
MQCDEIWSFIGCKEKNATPEMKVKGMGSMWTWTALDSDTKLVPCWFVGPRDATSAYHFMHNLASRMATRMQLTTDGLKAYLQAAEDAFGSEIDYAQLVKIYGREVGPNFKEAQVRYSPPPCIGARKRVVSGDPDPVHISTSHTERQNLSMRMGMRRFTRLTNAFSKKLQNHERAVALYFMYYNFCRIHQTLRVTPAMEAKIADHVWDIKEIVALVTSQ